MGFDRHKTAVKAAAPDAVGGIRAPLHLFFGPVSEH